MSLQGRSLDDLPLAAYSRGVVPADDEPEPPPDPGYTSVPAPSSSTAELVAQSHAESSEAAAPGRKLSLPFRLPRFGRGKQPAIDAEAPFQAVAASPDAPARPFEPITARAFEPMPQRPFEPAHVTVPVGGGPAGPARRLPIPRLPGLPGGLPKLQLRDRRVLAGGTVAIGLVLLAVSLLGGGGPSSGAGGPSSSQGTTGAVETAAPASATVELTGGGSGTFTLNGTTGSGPAVDSRVDATWSDVLGQYLQLSGMASQGTRTTDANFVLSWTMVTGGKAITFTSRAAECTIGMAVGREAVHGTFVCKKLQSADGKKVIDLRGNYTT